MKDLKLLEQVPADVDISAGQLRTSGSLYNAVFLSLFVPSSWQNEFLRQKLESRIPEMMQKNLTNQNRLNIIAEAERVLEWLVPEVAESVAVTATIPARGRLNLEVKTNQPDNTLNYQLNWESMR